MSDGLDAMLATLLLDGWDVSLYRQGNRGDYLARASRVGNGTYSANGETPTEAVENLVCKLRP